jgi:hypothetical protein
VTLSTKAAKSAKSAVHTQSNHHPVTPKTSTSTSPAPAHTHVPVPSDAAVVVAPDTPTVTAAPPAAASGSASPPSTVSALAKKVLAQLDAIEAMLDLNIVIPPNDKHQFAALNRVTDTAIGLASDIVSAAPDRFPDFTELPAAASYVQSVGLVASRAEELAKHVQNSVQNQRAPAATKTLALYAVAKGLGRIEGNETMREKVTALKAEIAPKRKDPKPKVTKGEKAVRRHAEQQAAHVTKAMKVLTAAGVTLPAAVAAPPSPASVTLVAASNGAIPSNAAAASNAALATPAVSH